MAEQREDAPVAATAAVEAGTLGNTEAATARGLQTRRAGPRRVRNRCRHATDAARRHCAEGQPRRATTGVSAKPPRSDSKEARLIAMLQRGASIDDMTREFGWLRHCHGALAGLEKKRGLNITSNRLAQGERIYRLDAPAEERQPRRLIDIRTPGDCSNGPASAHRFARERTAPKR